MFHLKEGDKAPVFQGRDQNGELVSLKDYKGKKVILFFYPKDSTATCTVQACNLRDNYSDLTGKGFEVVGVSADGEKSHQKFINKNQLPYKLLADEDRSILELYGVWGEKKFMGRIYDGIHRTTFLINEQGIIDKIIRKPQSKRHTDEILEIWK